MRAFKKRVFFDLLAYQLKKLLKNWKNPNVGLVKLSSRNEGFKDKKRRGRLIVLNITAKIVLKKVRCKRDYTQRDSSHDS